MLNIDTTIQQQMSGLTDLRRRLHRIPELGYEEFKTAAMIRAELDRRGGSGAGLTPRRGFVSLSARMCDDADGRAESNDRRPTPNRARFGQLSRTAKREFEPRWPPVRSGTASAGGRSLNQEKVP